MNDDDYLRYLKPLKLITVKPLIKDTPKDRGEGNARLGGGGGGATIEIIMWL